MLKNVQKKLFTNQHIPFQKFSLESRILKISQLSMFVRRPRARDHSSHCKKKPICEVIHTLCPIDRLSSHSALGSSRRIALRAGSV